MPAFLVRRRTPCFGWTLTGVTLLLLVSGFRVVIAPPYNGEVAKAGHSATEVFELLLVGRK